MNKNYLKEILLDVNMSHKKGQNIIKKIKSKFNIKKTNSTLPILLSYDLQAGQYNKNKSTKLRKYYDQYGSQLAEILCRYSISESSFIEVGCGECTSMESILKHFNKQFSMFYGFDVSWSRIYEGKSQIKPNKKIQLFVADLFSIPLKDNSVDIVYSSHSLEPNGGREEDALKELIRIARDKVILFEPIYELASSSQKERMKEHGYIRNLKKIIEKLNHKVLEYSLLPIFSNPLNQTGVIVIKKNKSKKKINKSNNLWKCPITDEQLFRFNDLFYNKEIGIAYPVIRNIPLLRSEHLFVASKLKKILK